MKRLSFLVALLLGMVVLVACPRGSVAGPLSAPSKLQATPGSSEIVLTWQDNSTAEEGFRIYRKLESEEEFPTDFLDETPPDAETYTDTLVSSTDTYVYQVRAFAGESEGELSQASNAAQPTLAENEVTLQIINVGSGSGITTSTPPGINCNSRTGGDGCSSDFERGTTVVLTANSTEDPPSVFSGFSGACTTTELNCEIVMDAAKEVTTTFAEAQPGITVQLSGDSGAGRVVDFTGPEVGGPYINCTGPSSDCSEADYFNIGNTVVLYAEPAEGSLFVDWEGCDRVSDDTRGGGNTPDGRCDFTVDTTNVITATFLEERDAPTATLTASPTVVAPIGTNVTLSWTVDDKGSSEPFTLELTDSQGNNYNDRIPDSDTGSVFIPVSSSRIFTLRVTNVFGTGTTTASVTQGEVPTIGTFTATPAELPTTGGDVTLIWSGVTGVDSPSSTLVIERTPGADIDVKGDADSTIVVPQTVSTTYTLVADNEFGDPISSPTRTVTISELQPPTITAFTATPTTSPSPGSPVILAWTLGGGTPNILTIDQGVGSVLGDPDSQVAVNPTETTTYTLTTRNAASGTTPATATATVTVTPNPTITSFTALDTTFAVGGTAQLDWIIDGTPTGITLLIGTEEAPAACQPAPTATSTTCAVTAPSTPFRLRVTPGNATAGPVPVTTGAPPATTIGTIDAGIVPGTYTINWTQAGTGPVSYVLTGPPTATIPPILDDATSVTIAGAATGEVYTLTATNQFGTTAGVLGTDPAPVTATIP